MPDSDLSSHGAVAGVASYPWLLADIGGSNARFAWVPHPGALPQHVRTLAVAEYPQLLDAARAYLDGLQHAGVCGEARPRSAAFAVATVTGGERVEFTNSPWNFSPRVMSQQLGLERPLQVLNDFEALALSLPRLRESQWRSLDARKPRFDAPVAVVGSGTGLGVAGLMPLAKGWLAVPGEGGARDPCARRSFRSRPGGGGLAATRPCLGRALPVGHRPAGAVPRDGGGARRACAGGGRCALDRRARAGR